MHSTKCPRELVERCIRLDDTRNQSVLFEFMSTPSARKKTPLINVPLNREHMRAGKRRWFN